MSTVQLYTWRDVERSLASVRTPPWEGVWCDGAGVTVAADASKSGAVSAAFAEVFGSKFDGQALSLESVESARRQLPVTVEAPESAPKRARAVRPLWPEAFQSRPPLEAVEGPQVIAFYSYKGGVGRTTCAFAVLGALLEQDRGVLLIDADLEAPGASWNIARSPERLSLIDLLGVLHDAEDWQRDALPLIASRVRQAQQSLELPWGRRDFYFVPAFRDAEQLFNPLIDFEQVVRARGRANVVAEVFAALGSTLGVDAVLVDLRAGVTEVSAPLLLDPRVQGVIVTSCSLQSVEGTTEVLRRMRENTGPSRAPEVVISMVPPVRPSGFLDSVEESLLTAFPASDQDDSPLSGAATGLHRVDFAQELLHFEGVEDLLGRRLGGTDLGKRVAPELVKRLVPMRAAPQVTAGAAVQPPASLDGVISLAGRLEYAEQNDAGGLLPIPALAALAAHAPSTAPASVVLGSKGAGKTFAWAQMVIAGTWSRFVELLRIQRAESAVDPSVFPLLAPTNLSPELSAIVADAEGRVRSLLGQTGRVTTTIASARQRIGKYKGKSDELQFWTSVIAARLGLDAGSGGSVVGLVHALELRKCPIVLVIDGLEDALQFELTLDGAQRGLLRGLLQQLTNEVREQGSPYLGIVTFVRRDLAEDAIVQNFGQFEALHSRAALTWSSTDALRLPAWILGRAGRPVLSEEEIPRASYEQLQNQLQQFWGVRLGSEKSKEAYTDRWIIAALSDLQGRLQPRDLVRLIRRAAELSRDAGADRLTPQALRSALPHCSEKKVKELEAEVRSLKGLFEKLRKAPAEKKVIPFDPKDFKMTGGQIEFLKKQGIVTSLENSTELYMPEIIRQGLGFKLREGRRAKVLALYRAIQAKSG